MTPLKVSRNRSNRTLPHLQHLDVCDAPLAGGVAAAVALRAPGAGGGAAQLLGLQQQRLPPRHRRHAAPRPG